MKMKSMVLFAVAIGLGLFAMLSVQKVMSQNQGAEAEYGQVLVALTDIVPGVPLDESNVSFRKWPKDAIPEGAVTTEEQYIERALKAAAVSGEVIMAAKLGEKGVFGASSEIPDGMRAVTVSVDPTKTHSGQIQPDDRVDVLVTYKTRSKRGMITRTKAVLEYIQVFSVDNRRAGIQGEAEEAAAKNISLLVTPDQANLLMLAENKGMLHLALRHKTDSDPAKPAMIDDSFFDDVDTQLGERTPEPEEPKRTMAPPDPKNIAEALKRELGGQGTPPAGPPGQEIPAEPGPEMWKVQIYTGKEVRVEEVELPPEKPETKEEPTKVSHLWKTIQGLVSEQTQ